MTTIQHESDFFCVLSSSDKHVCMIYGFGITLTDINGYYEWMTDTTYIKNQMPLLTLLTIIHELGHAIFFKLTKFSKMHEGWDWLWNFTKKYSHRGIYYPVCQFVVNNEGMIMRWK